MTERRARRRDGRLRVLICEDEADIAAKETTEKLRISQTTAVAAERIASGAAQLYRAESPLDPGLLEQEDITSKAKDKERTVFNIFILNLQIINGYNDSQSKHNLQDSF